MWVGMWVGGVGWTYPEVHPHSGQGSIITTSQLLNTGQCFRGWSPT